MSKSGRYMVFMLEGQKYALNFFKVRRIVHAVEVTPLPKAPEIVLGIINVEGRVIPVFNTRKRFGLCEREIELSDHLVIAQAARRTVALLVDRALGVVECPESDTVPDENIMAGIEYVEGIIKSRDGMIIIHDLDKFLSLEEEKKLDMIL